jgi:uncharacterized protein YjeT (DUF2065 family)
MGLFLGLVGLIFVVEGVLMILAPKKIVKMVSDLLLRKNARAFGCAPLAVGILLLFSASSSALGWLVVFLGLAGIVKAIYTFLTPIQRVRSHWWFSLSDNGHRGLGILILILGVIVFISRV